MRKALHIVVWLLLTSVSARAGVWDKLFELPEEKRKAASVKIIGPLYSTLDSAKIFLILDTLEQSAVKHRDERMEIASHFYRGAYFTNLATDMIAPKSIAHFQKGLELAERYHISDEVIIISNILGYELLVTGKKAEGLGYMLRGDKILKETGYENFPKVHRVLVWLAEAYRLFSNYDRSIYYLEAALKYGDADKKGHAVIYNQLALNWKSKEVYDKALHYFQKSLVISEELQDSVAMAKVKANIGTVYTEKKEFGKAKKLLQEAYRLNTQFGCWDCLSTVLTRMLEIEIGLNDLAAANEHRTALRSLIQAHKLNKYTILSGYYEQSARYYQAKKDYSRTTLYLDSFLVVNDSLTREKDAHMLANLEAQVSAENYMAEKAVFEKENSRQRAIRNASWIISGMTIISLMGMLYSLRMRQRRKQRILELEKQKAEWEQHKAEEQVNNYRNKLKHFIEDVRKKNRLIEQLRERVDISDSQSAHPVKTKLLDQLHAAVILTEQDWIEFKRLFEKVHPGFTGMLQQEYPDLTVAELRFLVLIKLNLSVPEIAAMLGIAPRSVFQTRQRVRDKLGLSKSKDIINLIAKLEEQGSGVAPYAGLYQAGYV